jgi:hypothetical protein
MRFNLCLFFFCLSPWTLANELLASELGERFCEREATAFFQGYHLRVKDEWGLQSLSETVTLIYEQELKEIDQRYESYHFTARVESGTGAAWVFEYLIPVEAWLSIGGVADFCNIGELQYLGVT